MNQMSIFDYPNHAGAVAHSPTSVAAADAIEPVRRTMCQKILEYIALREDGATSSEVCVALNARINSVTARIRELVMSGQLADTETTRNCPSSGFAKTVYKATGNTPQTMPKTLSKAQVARRDTLLEIRQMIVEHNAAAHGYASLSKILESIDAKVSELA